MKTTEDILWTPIETFYKERVKLIKETLARYNKASESERLEIFNELKQTFYRFDSLNRQLNNVRKNFECMKQSMKKELLQEIKPHLDQIKMLERRYGLEGGRWQYEEEY